MMIFRKILTFASLLLVLGLAALAILISYNSDCPSPQQQTNPARAVTAVHYECYGPPEVLQFKSVTKPVAGEDEVLVKVQAAGINPLDWHYMRGSPYIMRLGTGLGAPKDGRIGVDFSGIVEAVGKNVTRFKPGDTVFGGGTGAFAQYLAIDESAAVAPKPDNLSFTQAASIGIAGITAVQALRDKGQLQAGESVLINGASGGVGTFAVQIARAMDARITGVCSTRNLEMVRSLGADRVIDYKQEDYTRTEERYDLIVDMVGNHSPLANAGTLKPGGRYVMVGGAKGDWLGPLLRPIQSALVAPFVDQELILLMARLDSADLEFLGSLMQKGKVTPVIDREYSLDEIRDAIAYSESGRARGKIVLKINGAGQQPGI